MRIYVVYDKERMWVWITTFHSYYHLIKKDTEPCYVGIESCWNQVSGPNIKLLGNLPIMGQPHMIGVSHDAALPEADLRTKQ
jgi:hypothetical protein